MQICSENEDGTTNLAPICFVSYLSFNPPMIGFATGKQAHTGERVRETGKVIVTVPGETLSQAVMSCGSSTGSKVNKATEYGIEMVDVENSSIKIPKDTKVAFVAALKETLEVGDHILHICRYDTKQIGARLVVPSSFSLQISVRGLGEVRAVASKMLSSFMVVNSFRFIKFRS